MRSRLLAAIAALAVLAVCPGEAAGAFGASLSPVPLIYERDQAVEIANKSDIPVTARLQVDGAGWRLAEGELNLAAGERRSVDITAAGKDDATLRVIVRPALASGGSERISIVLEGRLRHLSWLDTFDARPWLIVVLVLAAGVLIVARRLLRGRAVLSRVAA